MKHFFLLYYLALSAILCPFDTICKPCKLTMGIAPIISVAPVMSVAPVISLGALIMSNPVTAILGAATTLATIAQNALQTYMQQNSLLSPNIPLPPEVILAERSYYEQRIISLEGLKQEFLSLKKDLEAFRFLKGTHQTTFTYEFLNHINQLDTHHKDPLLHISAQREKHLTANQKENLRFLRETELQRIEQEITSLQTTLVVHINVLIEQVSAAGHECHVFQEKIDQDIKLWNKNLNNITYNTALQLYQTELHQAYLLNSLKQKVDELQMTAHYYRSNVNTSCMEKSTNIFSILETIDPLITHFNQFITDHKTVNDNNIRVTEKHFIDRGINIQQIRNDIKKNLEQSRNNRAKQTIAQAKNKLENIVVAGSPNPQNNNDDNNNNNNDIFYKQIKLKFHKKFRHPYFGNFYRDPQTKLIWSKDNAGHGGVVFKVFKETSKGLKWIFDADGLGNEIIGKHKGPTGLFIPHKELIPCQ